jgi:deoxyguanosine kinase
MKTLNYLVIEGNIGAGKTTLAKLLSDEYNGRLILEKFQDNPFLPHFYTDPQRYSFPLEMAFLAERYQQLTRELNNRDLFKPLTISDYYFMKSLIFSRTNLSADEFKLYRQLFDIIYTSVPKPDLYVYLHLDYPNLIRNIHNRGRYFEQNIQTDYLVKIQEGYMDFFRQNNNDLSILVLDINQLDFLNKPGDYTLIKEIIFNSPREKGITKLILSPDMTTMP